MNELIKLSELESLSKSDLLSLSNQLMTPVDDGEVDPLKQLINIKKLIFLLEDLEPKVRAIAEEKTFLSRGEKMIIGGAEISEKDNARYDYKVCNDPALNKAQQTVKDRQTFLKTLKEKIVLVDEDSGETTEIFPPIKSGKLGLNISIK